MLFLTLHGYFKDEAKVHPLWSGPSLQSHLLAPVSPQTSPSSGDNDSQSPILLPKILVVPTSVSLAFGQTPPLVCAPSSLCATNTLARDHTGPMVLMQPRLPQLSEHL